MKRFFFDGHGWIILFVLFLVFLGLWIWVNS